MMWCGTNVFVLRQVLLGIAVCLISFSFGITLAFPSVLNPAILSSDADLKVTPDQASWIATCLSLGGLMGYIFIPTVFDTFGSKTANIVTNLFILIGSVLLYIATDVYSLAFARLAQGLFMGGTYMTSVSLCECISPKRRECFIFLKSLSFSLGSFTCHALGLILNWRQIALFGALGNLISIILFSISSESPVFLAMHGQFDKCAESFEWYRGDSLNAKREFKELFSAEKENFRIEERNDIEGSKTIIDMFMSKNFQKSFCILALVQLCVDTCGRHYLVAYITQILMELTNNTTLSLYMSVATDLVLIVALVISAVSVKHFKPTSLFKFGLCSVFLMFMVSFSIIFNSQFKVLREMKWITPVLILLHIFVTNVGLVPLSVNLSVGVFSMDQKRLGAFISGIIFLFYFNVIIKLTPFMVDKTGVEGTFSIYAIILFISLVLLRRIVPENKAETLQEINADFKETLRITGNSDTALLNQSKLVTEI